VKIAFFCYNSLILPHIPMVERTTNIPAETPDTPPNIEVPPREPAATEKPSGDTGAVETQRVTRDVTEKRDVLHLEIESQRIDGTPDTEKKAPTTRAEQVAATAAGFAGGLGKLVEAFKKVSDRLDPIRENLARALGPMFGTEVPGPLKAALGFSSLGMLPMLENFTGKYGVFYKNLTKNKMKILDTQFTAKGFLAEYDTAVSEGLQLPLDEYIRRVAAHLHQKRGAGEISVNGKELAEAGKTVVQQEKSAVVQAEKKPETQTIK
jgi:hypothetical protein